MLSLKNLTEEIKMSKTIELTDEQWATLHSGEDITLKAPKKVVQWEPAAGDYTIFSDGDFEEVCSTRTYALFGTERDTYNQAKKAAKEMRIFNRLLAYRDEFDSEFDPDWNDYDQKKCWIEYMLDENEYGFDYSYTTNRIGSVAFSEDAAKKLIAKLNSGEVVL